MKLIVSCFVSLMLIVSVGFADEPQIGLPDANNFFIGQDTFFIDAVNESMGPGINAILLAIYKIGYTLAIIATISIAIKLLLTTPAKKADVKQALMPYLIGLLLLIAGVPIAIKVIEIYTQLL